jgi:hypothetical protein
MYQGRAFPYTKGFHLICQLLAAANREDLDMINSRYQFPKTTLENLLGVQMSDDSYNHYRYWFMEAQKSK